MKENDTQQELFDDFPNEKRLFKRPRGLLTRPTYVSIPIERLIFIGIGVIMALVIAHATGLERGRTLSRVESKNPRLGRTTPAKTRQYTVLIGTFRQKASLDAVMQDLRKAGYSNSFVLTQGDASALCVGRFAAQEEAARLEKSLKTRYKDCVVKRI